MADELELKPVKISELQAATSLDDDMLFAAEQGGIAKKVSGAQLVAISKGEIDKGGFVSSFNGRAGTVTAQNGDYTADMVGAIPSTNVDAIEFVTEEEYESSKKTPMTLYLILEDD